MQAVLFANGRPPGRQTALKAAANRRVFCADGALSYLLPYGIVPHVLVGDFDSAPEELVLQAQEAGARLYRLPAAKNDSDLAVAAQLAREEGCTDFLLLGCFGGRTDHFLCNLSVLCWLAESGASAEMRGGTRITAVKNDYNFTRIPKNGFSLVPFGGEAVIEKAYNLLYNANKTFSPQATLGLSNGVAQLPAGFTVAKGTVLLVENA